MDNKLERFIKLEHDGTYCIVEPRDAEMILADDNETPYDVSNVYMTREDFLNLPEFEGF